MDNSLRTLAQSGQRIKKFSFIRNGNVVLTKPKNNEQFFIVEDFLGDRSLVWVACVSDGKELWRHTTNDIIRLTFE